MALSFEYLSEIVGSPDLLSHLGRKPKIRRFQWNGPHFLAILRYAVTLNSNSEHDRFTDLLRRLEDSAYYCFLGKNSIYYKRFLEMLVSFMPKLWEFLAVPKPRQYLFDAALKKNELVASFVAFLIEDLGEILNSGTNSGVLVSDQIKVLLKELKFLLTFLDRITLAKMDLVLSDLLQRIDMVKTDIKEHCITVSNLPCFTNLNTAVISVFIVDSLLDDLNDLINHKPVLILEVKDQITALYEELNYSRFFLKDIDVQHNKELIECVMRLRDLAYEAEYIINSFVVGEVPVWYLTMRLSSVILTNRVIRTKLSEIKMNLGIGRLEVVESPREVSSQRKNIPMVDEIIVGFEDERIQIASQLVGGPHYLQIISIIGMPGLGKTTLAKKLYNDSSVVYHFDKRSWTVVSQTYQKRKQLIDILSPITDLSRDTILNMDNESLAENLYKNLKGRRYLIIMDDMWSKEAWDDLKRYFPNDRNGSRILFTSRLKDVALQTSSHGIINELRFLSVDECWDLLQKKVFQKEGCPPKLIDIGKQIATNCQGLPLAVVVISAVLANMEKKESLWQEVASNLSSYIFENPNKNILDLSYMHLPIHLKPCFLYFGAFEEDRDIPIRKLLSLWIAEGFVQKREHKSLEDVAEEYLMDLINRSLVQVSKRRSDSGVKACSIHDLIRDMCLRIAKEENFLNVIKNQFSIYEQHQHLCIHSNFGNSKSRLFGLHIRSLLGYFVSPLFIVPSLKLLRVLELLTANGIKSHLVMGIEFLVYLRYLAIPWLPSSISRLDSLEFLVLGRADVIPPLLLNMPKLRCLHVVTLVSFSKNCQRSQMNSLQTLSCVHIIHLKDEDVLRCFPNLRRLKCTYNQSWNRCPDLSFLAQLESLSLVFLGNSKEIKLPMNIKKLTLSNIRLPFEKMSLIGTLPNLEILKLECDAFEGRSWNTKDDEFQKLKFLKLERLKLAQWNASSSHFPMLERLVLQNCYNLRKIPSELSDIPTLQMIEVHCCDIYVRNSVMKIQQEQLDNGNQELKVIISGTVWNFILKRTFSLSTRWWRRTAGTLVDAGSSIHSRDP
ncbi:late blight resistance homolog R1A-3 [Olea europaea subsp. europaea]|uniref:Late blight resistance homolog R1A-3 n=2 Tax=Olea europaea subsp. europaea TaxID=158383 RepID=A0A8S0PS55_OLEEU|nr:late blight resistance homolog R1A-3 [Olea europaea subsp. europaea]